MIPARDVRDVIAPPPLPLPISETFPANLRLSSGSAPAHQASEYLATSKSTHQPPRPTSMPPALPAPAPPSPVGCKRLCAFRHAAHARRLARRPPRSVPRTSICTQSQQGTPRCAVSADRASAHSQSEPCSHWVAPKSAKPPKGEQGRKMRLIGSKVQISYECDLPTACHSIGDGSCGCRPPWTAATVDMRLPTVLNDRPWPGINVHHP